jgi:phosphoglycerol transferase MdoB-like AlkP superfamily enzyme
MESYLTIAGFSHITEDGDFDLSLNASKWGVHDQYVFNRLLNEVDTASAPFFKTMLSLSSHEPFDVPFGNSKQKDETGLFLNSCSYTDSCLGQFIRDAKQKDWWKNTLVIITADHGHSFPYHYQVYDKRKFKIPMLWLGGAVDSAFHVNKIGNQTDIANTLLGQLNIDYADFTFGKNMLASKSKPFAVYAFNNGFGYVDPDMESVYDFDFRNYLKGKGSSSEAALAYGKAYMQILFNDYNKR